MKQDEEAHNLNGLGKDANSEPVANTKPLDGASDTTVDTVLVLGPAGPSTNTTVGA